jgi:predicted nucleic acid-binding protein
MKYALDTNVVSSLLKRNRQLQERIYREQHINNADIIIPAIVYYETKRGLIDCKACNKLAKFERYFESFGVADINNATLNKATDIYVALKQSGKLIDDGDIFIGASCIVHGYTLITDNTRHFERIAGLQHENWLID